MFSGGFGPSRESAAGGSRRVPGGVDAIDAIVAASPNLRTDSASGDGKVRKFPGVRPGRSDVPGAVPVDLHRLGNSGSMEPGSYFTALAACAVRGTRPDAPVGLGDTRLCEWGIAEGLRLHHFKRKIALPRVERALGALAQLRPATLLDIGSGRGTFLWPLLDRFETLSVTVVEPDAERARQLSAVAAGGMERLEVLPTRAEMLTAQPWHLRRWEVATILEVLEHVEDPETLAKAVVGSATSAVIASVPSTPDENPGHVRLFTQQTLRGLLLEAGASRVSITQVPNHLVAVATGLRS